MNELIKLSAREAVTLLKKQEVSPLELIDAAEEQIQETNTAINAIPTLCIDRARKNAQRIMKEAPSDLPPHYLYGLPIAVKDLVEVEGVRTTFGSPIYADHVSDHSDYLVERLERNGAVVIGKSNTPEFGAGSHTFNEVFGHTHNPWNTGLTAGGSSGGAAAALAAGQVWLATGSDLGGSLRNPASFCSVVGLRPSPGRVAHGPSALSFNDLSVDGPMGRNIADVALMLDAQTGRDARDPISLPSPETPFTHAASSPTKPTKIAFSPNLGFLPVDPEVAKLCEAAAKSFQDMGIAVEEACIDFTGADEIFHVLRGQLFAAGRQHFLDKRELLKPEVIWNIEAGLQMSGEQIASATHARGQLFQRAITFFDEYDLLLCPAAAVPPFDGTMRYPTEIDGTKLERYIDWLMICGMITLTGCAAASIPCGFTKTNKPVGLQVVARPRGEAEVISACSIFEQAHPYADMVPIKPKLPTS